MSVAGGLTVGWEMQLGEWDGGDGTLEVVGSSANISTGGNFEVGLDTTTSNTLRFVPDSGGISTINVTGQTYFWPGTIELDIADGPIPVGTYTLISSTLGTDIEDMDFAPGVNTNRFSFEVVDSNDLVLNVLLPPDCPTFLGGDMNNDCTVNFVVLAMMLKDCLVTVP